MSNEFDADKAEHEAVLAQERRRLSKQKDLAENMQKGFEKYVTEALKDPRNKQTLGQQGVNVMNACQQGFDPIKMLNQGKNAQRFSALEEGECTGLEDRPWERE